VAGVCLISGCETMEPPTTGRPILSAQGVYHKVQKGETLWRIAKTYQASIEDIIRMNNIPSVAHIEENQLLFIPGATKVLEPETLRQQGSKEEFAWPVKGKVLKYFGERRGAFLNKGINIEADKNEAVQASRAGKVVFADYLAGYAYTVIVDHLDGLSSVYAKNSKLLVKLGDAVSQGQPIAQAGQIGKAAYLHFEIRKNGLADNPLYYLPKI
jgi:murein DD-endopeptidase MepM/ murein hydrolase activator NlpD